MSEIQTLPAIRPNLAAGGAVGALVPQTIDEAWRLSEAFAKAGILPRGISTAPQVMLVICGGAEVGFGPFQSLQSFYLVNNRLTLWGDAIPALLWSNGFKLKEWFENVDPAYPDSMVAKCLVTRPDGTEIEGEFSVADAKEAKLWSKDGPWQTAKKRMLKMRARAFAARDGAPDVLRGIQIREEVEDYDIITEVRTAPQALTSDFQDNRNSPAQAREAVATKRAARAKAAEKPQDAPSDPEQGNDGDEPARAVGEVLEGDDLPEALRGVRPTETASAPNADAGQDTSDSATDALGDTAAETSGHVPSDAEVHEGHAEPGEVYLMADAPALEDGRRLTFKDGQRFSSVGPDGATALKVYDDHAPELAEEEEEGGVEIPPEMLSYAKQVQAATDFQDVKKALMALQKTEHWKAITNEQADEVRFNTWTIMVATGLAEKLVPSADVSAYRLWLEWEEDPEVIENMLATMEEHPDFAAKPDTLKENIRGATKARLAVLEA